MTLTSTIPGPNTARACSCDDTSTKFLLLQTIFNFVGNALLSAFLRWCSAIIERRNPRRRRMERIRLPELPELVIPEPLREELARLVRIQEIVEGREERIRRRQERLNRMRYAIAEIRVAHIR